MKNLILSLLLLLTSCESSTTDKDKYDLVWEPVSSNHETLHRARVYGGWLVRSYKTLTFMPLNHPDNWVLKK